MADYEATVPSTWSREQTFDYLADFRNVAEWDPSMQRADLVSGTAGQAGAAYRLVMTMAGKPVELTYTATEVQRPERFVMRCETDSIVSVDTISVAPDAAVTYSAALELRGARKLADPLAQVGLTRASEKARESLAGKLASNP